MLPPLVKLGVNVLFITFELRIIVSGSSASEFELIVILTFVVKCSDQAVLHHYRFFLHDYLFASHFYGSRNVGRPII
jgi:hypothetical protein